MSDPELDDQFRVRLLCAFDSTKHAEVLIAARSQINWIVVQNNQFSVDLPLEGSVTLGARLT